MITDSDSVSEWAAAIDVTVGSGPNQYQVDGHSEWRQRSTTITDWPGLGCLGLGLGLLLVT